MDHFNYKDKRLLAEDVPLTTIAEKLGTPCYVYSRATLTRHFKVFDQALTPLPHKICYSVKANSNIAVLNVLARLGSGFDIVSGGELARVLAAGGDPKKIVFSGVGKTVSEMQAALAANIFCFNVESTVELERLNQVAATCGKIAHIALRVNPDVDAKTHPYIATGLTENKFGIPIAAALERYRLAKSLKHLHVSGIACHIGSQLTQIEPFVEVFQHLLALKKQLRAEGIAVDHIDLGGGLGVRYQDENPPLPADYVAALLAQLGGDKETEIIIEPGRAIAANAGVLLTRVEYLKKTPHKNFAIVDCAMNDLIRPALYQAWQDIVPVNIRESETLLVDVVGPICETGDFLGKARHLAIEVGDLLAIRTAGAYGFCMSSNYNSRPRAAEIMVDGDQYHCVRARETINELFATEKMLVEHEQI